MSGADLIVRHIGQLVNPASDRVARGGEAGRLRVERDACIAARAGRICYVGPESGLGSACRPAPDAREIDAGGAVALPGFVDAHTHLPFAGTRQDEFRLKLQGASYQEIAAAGGGIRSTVRRTREIGAGELLEACRLRLDRMLLSGTTTAEAKSGYGLDAETELKQLRALRGLAGRHPVEVVPTFMGAHEIPDEFRGRNRGYLDHLLREVLPQVRREGLAEFVDIFCEDGYFSYDEAEAYLAAAAAMGFRLKVHADEFASNGAGELAARLGALSAEHLIVVRDDEIAALAASGTACVLLPGVSFFLRLGRYAPARKILDAGGIVALGSDFNPGSSMISSMLFVFHLAVFQLGLTIEQALNAVTINAAYAVARQERAGSLAVGKDLDLLLLDVPDYPYLAYHPGIDPLRLVLKAGQVVVRDRRRAEE